ncbi:hypothetical protein AVEN_24216-1 [Araneus ventricosus]|uniref:Uncharacterized protein n=1 Tax=Araneus ventricosus TaxID=182803 RepID=A0A4Y2GX88_ARAVE|nr:hypothetical protein AVEN_24216-1 [Araneus ventricosus]
MSSSASSRRKCLNNPNTFCYTCGSFTIPSQMTNISTFVRKAYFAYFKVKIGDQYKSWAPHKVYKQCVESLRMWTKGRRDNFPFGIPMIWREPRDHSTIRSVPHLAEIPVTVFKELPSLEIQKYESGEDRSDTNDEDFEIEDNSVRKGFQQHELNDLARDLGLSEKASELLASRLHEKKLAFKRS